jgi:hypothetical protein
MAGAPTHAAENAPLLTNVEEYTVFVAVLFPKEQTIDAPDAKPHPYHKPSLDTGPMHLDGITGNSYRLSRFTIAETRNPENETDQGMTADYNHRNKQVYRLDEKKLLSLTPKDGRVVLVDPGESRTKEKTIFSSEGTTYISRPGFNQDMTQAIMQISHVADPEMGVGYQVYLEKSSSTGQWSIIGFDLNRRY